MPSSRSTTMPSWRRSSPHTRSTSSASWMPSTRMRLAFATFAGALGAATEPLAVREAAAGVVAGAGASVTGCPSTANRPGWSRSCRVSPNPSRAVTVPATNDTTTSFAPLARSVSTSPGVAATDGGALRGARREPSRSIGPERIPSAPMAARTYRPRARRPRTGPRPLVRSNCATRRSGQDRPLVLDHEVVGDDRAAGVAVLAASVARGVGLDPAPPLAHAIGLHPGDRTSAASNRGRVNFFLTADGASSRS